MIKAIFKVIIILVIVISLIPLLILTFLGLVPGLSSLVGAGPKDFGIKVTKDDSKAARTLVGTEVIAIKSNDGKSDFTLEGKKDAVFSMDSKILTAFFNNNPWKNHPVKNVQILIHPDGTVEGSGILVVSKAIPYAMALGYSEGQIRDAMSKYNIPPIEVPIYVKGTGSAMNDKVTVNASSVKIGAISVPGNIVSQANNEAVVVLEDIIQKHSGSFHAESLIFSDGKMNFKGYVPQKKYILTE